MVNPIQADKSNKNNSTMKQLSYLTGIIHDSEKTIGKMNGMEMRDHTHLEKSWMNINERNC